MRLIDADMLDFTMPENPDPLTAAIIKVVKDDINKCPTVDAVSVVRCKDCIHYGEVGDCEVHPHDGRFNVNYFCADGEKKA